MTSENISLARLTSAPASVGTAVPLPNAHGLSPPIQPNQQLSFDSTGVLTFGKPYTQGISLAGEDTNGNFINKQKISHWLNSHQLQLGSVLQRLGQVHLDGSSLPPPDRRSFLKVSANDDRRGKIVRTKTTILS